jgi:hypothetical protein
VRGCIREKEPDYKRAELSIGENVYRAEGSEMVGGNPKREQG